VVIMVRTEERRIYMENRRKTDRYRERKKIYNSSRKERTKELSRINNQKIRENAFIILGGAFCKKCKLSDVRFLTVNHINGRKDKNETGHKLWRKIISGERDIDDLEVLCLNCNIIHEYTIGNRGGDNRSEIRQRRKIRALSKIGTLECKSCKTDDIRVLSINHINGHEIKVTERKCIGHRLYRAIDCYGIDVTNFEILCMNCNILYEYERGIRKFIE